MNRLGFEMLRGLRVLVVEDEHLIAMALTDELEAAGALVLGPATSIDGALAAIERDEPAGVVLDAELQGELATPIADLLTERAIPFVLTTGFDSEALPGAFQSVPKCPKPATSADVLGVLCQALRSGGEK